MKAIHLTTRFVGSLWPFGPRTADDSWARSHLLEGEIVLWDRMCTQDRRHSVGVARRVDEHLGVRATRPVLAAALLHDVGKVESGLGTFLRVVATLSAAVAGRDMADAWILSSGVTRRVGLYLKHPEIGGDLLAMAGSEEFTEQWARQHHLPEDDCTLDRDLAHALRISDDD